MEAAAALGRLSSLAASSQEAEPSLRTALAEMRASLDASAAFIIYGHQDQFAVFTSGPELGLSQTALWLINQDLTVSSVPRIFQQRGARIVDFGNLEAGRPASGMAMCLPVRGTTADMLVVLGPWEDGLSADQVILIEAAMPALSLLLGRYLESLSEEMDKSQFDALASIGRIVADGEDLETVLSSIAKAIAGIIKVDVVTIDIVGPQGTVDIRCVNYDLPQDTIAGDRWGRAKDRPDPIRDRVMSSRKPMTFPDTQSDERLSPKARAFFSRALLRSVGVFPLAVGDDVLGVISVAASRPRRFEPSDVAFLLGIAGQVATAVKGVRVYQELTVAKEALRSSEEKFRLLFADNPHPMWVFDRNTLAFLEVNEAAVRRYGYSRDEFLSMTVRDIRPSEDIPQLERARRERATSHLEGEWRHVYKNGQVVDAYIQANDLDFGGRPAVLALAQDITERKRAEEGRARLSAIIEATPDLVSITDPQGKRLYLNAAGRRLLSMEPGEVVESHIGDERPAWARRQLLDDSIPAATKEGSWEGETVYSGCDGIEIPVSELILAHKAEDGEVDFFANIAKDISERKQFEQKLLYIANHDSLTNLLNRRRLDEELERVLAESRRYATQGALLLLDIDQFKDVNDTRGHIAGDELLAALGNLLRGTMRETDVVARQGGDEFAILLNRCDGEAATARASEILHLVADHPFVVGDVPLRITVSIGVALVPIHGSTGGELLSRADVAMYQAKGRGRNQVCVFAPGADWEREIESRLGWYNRIREGLDADRFVLLGQPILDLRTRRITRYELLIRMLDARGQYILPGAFLDVAERTGLIKEIDRWVVRRAIKMLGEHQAAGGAIEFEVNLSGKAFEDAELPQIIQEELAAHRVDPSSLIFEVTETAAIANMSQAQAFLHTLKRVGCQFALDDFGVGFSSFYYLKHLPVDYLKIDGSFIRHMARSTVDQHMVQAMVGLANALSKPTIAEYVNDEETLRLLGTYGVDFAQGFLIGEPARLPSVETSQHAA